MTEKEKLQRIENMERELAKLKASIKNKTDIPLGTLCKGIDGCGNEFYGLLLDVYSDGGLPYRIGGDNGINSLFCRSIEPAGIPWIKYDGDECPVDGHVEVLVMFKEDGFLQCQANYTGLDWKKTNINPITHYCVVNLPKK